MNPFVRIVLAACCSLVTMTAAASPPLDGISFAVVPGKLYLPLDEGNPARYLYEWIDTGTPVKVTRE